ncbi:unnamed protein product [Cyprideis torosa]|uniref:Uncharacterized protein n=1 Tax=Cyprideis torosa TaxID=163714 RepID=A0A7R8WLA6_9CRUS|nr:unnamed protein product [Cyprideis torosa]CAG0902290.1 unnamed protein product [Cyprideis torosa]
MVDRLVNSEENAQRLQRVEDCFGGSGSPLRVPGRVLVGEGVLTKVCRKCLKPRMFFLFNDILVYGTIIIPKKKFNQQHIIPLEQVKLTDVPDEESGKRPATEHAAVWIPDSEAPRCMHCKRTQFTLVNRRHHCRKCGAVVCGGCSRRKMLLPIQSSKPLRVCDTCFKGVTNEPEVPYGESSGEEDTDDELEINREPNLSANEQLRPGRFVFFPGAGALTAAPTPPRNKSCACVSNALSTGPVRSGMNDFVNELLSKHEKRRKEVNNDKWRTDLAEQVRRERSRTVVVRNLLPTILAELGRGPKEVLVFLEEQLKQNRVPTVPVYRELARRLSERGDVESLEKLSELFAESYSWEDLRDHMRLKAYVCEAEWKKENYDKAFDGFTQLILEYGTLSPKLGKKIVDMTKFMFLDIVTKKRVDLLPKCHQLMEYNKESLSNSPEYKSYVPIMELNFWRLCFSSDDFVFQNEANNFLSKKPDVEELLKMRIDAVVNSAQMEGKEDILYRLLDLCMSRGILEKRGLVFGSLLELQCHNGNLKAATETVKSAIELKVALPTRSLRIFKALSSEQKVPLPMMVLNILSPTPTPEALPKPTETSEPEQVEYRW